LANRRPTTRAAKAAIDAIAEIGSMKSVKALLKALSSAEKAKGKKKELLVEPLNQALKEITGGDCESSKRWKRWLKEQARK